MSKQVDLFGEPVAAPPMYLIGMLDTETRGYPAPGLVSLQWSIYDYDLNCIDRDLIPYPVKQEWKFSDMFKRYPFKRLVMYVHNSRFDLCVILRYLYGIRVKDEIKVTRDGLKILIIDTGGTMYARFEYEGRTMVISDSMAYTKRGLKDFTPETHEKLTQHEYYTGPGYGGNEQVIDYFRYADNDTQALRLLKLILSENERYHIPADRVISTASKCEFVFRRMNRGHRHEIPRLIEINGYLKDGTPYHIDRWNGYSGGWVDYYEHGVHDCVMIDVVSMYPWTAVQVMPIGTQPIEKHWKMITSPMYEGFVQVLEWDDRCPLPRKDWLPSPEARAAYKLGYEFKFGAYLAFPCVKDHALKHYMKTYIEEKKKFGKGSPERDTAKHFLNDLTGKFLQVTEKKKEAIGLDGKLFTEKILKYGRMHNFLIGSFITSRARARLLETMVTVEGGVIDVREWVRVKYHDTDSVHFTGDLNREWRLPIGSDLGDWEIEGEGSVYHFGKKCYRVHGEKSVFKGAARSFLDEVFYNLQHGGALEYIRRSMNLSSEAPGVLTTKICKIRKVPWLKALLKLPRKPIEEYDTGAVYMKKHGGTWPPEKKLWVSKMASWTGFNSQSIAIMWNRAADLGIDLQDFDPHELDPDAASWEEFEDKISDYIGARDYFIRFGELEYDEEVNREEWEEWVYSIPDSEITPTERRKLLGA